MTKTLSLITILFLSISGFSKTPIEDLLEKPSFSTLKELIVLSGLAKEILMAKKLTLLAPTNEAFSKLDPDLVEKVKQDAELLKKVIGFHFVKKKMRLKKIIKQQGMPTESGFFAQLDQIKLSATNIKTQTGVVHILSEVLLPIGNVPKNRIQTATYVDLERYQGKWYEYSKIPNQFEKNCFDVTAEYSLRKSGKVNVKNTCYLIDGKKRSGKAVAVVRNRTTQAELSVSFVPVLKNFGVFGGDYNILAIDENYEVALVGSKDRDFLWILSRTRDLDLEIYQKYVKIAADNGYPVDRLVLTPKL